MAHTWNSCLKAVEGYIARSLPTPKWILVEVLGWILDTWTFTACEGPLSYTSFCLEASTRFVEIYPDFLARVTLMFPEPFKSFNWIMVPGAPLVVWKCPKSSLRFLPFKSPLQGLALFARASCRDLHPTQGFTREPSNQSFRTPWKIWGPSKGRSSL